MHGNDSSAGREALALQLAQLSCDDAEALARTAAEPAVRALFEQVAAEARGRRAEDPAARPPAGLTVHPTAQPAAVAALETVGPKAAVRERLEYLTLLLRQLLFKYSLDRGPKFKSVVDFVQRRVKAVSTASPHAMVPEIARELSTEFHTSLEDATIIASYFVVPLSQMTFGEMDVITQLFMSLPDTAVEGTRVVHLAAFLSEEEIRHVLCAAEALSESEMPTAAGAEASAFPHHVKYGAAHSALFLHRDGHFASFCPKLSAKVQAAMRSQPQMYVSPLFKLNVRCAEFHTYTPGDGLSTKGHRDTGLWNFMMSIEYHSSHHPALS